VLSLPLNDYRPVFADLTCGNGVDGLAGGICLMLMTRRSMPCSPFPKAQVIIVGQPIRKPRK
jgi:hypothetical protein